MLYKSTFEFHFMIVPPCVPIVTEFWKATTEAAGLKTAAEM
jgi:hypothetical protein